MLTRSLRPQKFSEVVGNSLNMEILKAIARNPAETPSTIILEGSYGGGKCVVSGSRVLTSEGYIPIELLHEGGEGQYPYDGDVKVLTSSGWVTPSDTYMKRQEPVKEIKTHSGHSLGGTFHHRIATLTGDLRITYTRLDTLRKHNTVLLYQPVKFGDLPLVLERYWNLWSPYKSVGELTLVKPTTYSEAYNVVAGAFARCSVEGNPTIVGSYDTLKYLQDLATSVGVMTVFDTRSKLRLGTNAIAPIQRFIKYVLGTVKSWGSAKPIITLTRDQLELVNKEISKLGGVKQTYEVDILYVRDLLTDYYGLGWVREDTILTRVIKLLNWKQTTIESINEYVSDVYDLTVPGVHDFYVEGFISHNTTSARLLAKALNCEDFKDDICGKCKTCKSSLDSVPFYTEYDVTVIGAVDKIRDLRDTFYYTVPNHTRVIVFDECLGYDQGINIRVDGVEKRMKIGEVVNKRIAGEALSISPDGTPEYRKITGWFENSKKPVRKYSVQNIHGHKRINTLTASSKHIVYLADGREVEVGSLKVGDLVRVYSERYSDMRYQGKTSLVYNVPKVVRQMMLGSLLGDASLGKESENHHTRFKLQQSLAQEPWFKVKEYMLGDLMGKSSLLENKGWGDYIWVGKTISHPMLDEYWNLLYDERGQKKVTREYLELLDEVSIATWFMDDGSHSKGYRGNRTGSVSLATHGFTVEENEIIAEYFKDRWGIEFYLHEDNRGKGTYVITKTVKDANKFLWLIAPHVIPFFQSKMGVGIEVSCEYRDRIEALCSGSGRVVLGKVIDISEEGYDGRGHLYDIEVEGNHNYVASGIIVHNCHTASRAAQSALLKVLEEAPPGVKFVLATTDPEKLLPTIRSRSLELHFTTQTKADVIDNLLESAERLGISLSEDIADLIATRSKGHMRDAHMLLDQYMLVGEDTFRGVVRSSRMDILKLLVALRTKNKDGYFRAVDGVLTHPLVDIGDDFQSVLLDMVKSGLGEEVDAQVDKVGKLFGPIGALKLVQICSQEWFLKSFQNDVTLQTALLALYQLCNAQSPNKTPQTDRNKKV